MRSSCSGLALSPARMAAGSPGVSRSKRKTNSATTPITGTAASTRRNRYPSIVIHHTLRQPWDQVVADLVPARMDQVSKSCATGDPFWADVDDPSKLDGVTLRCEHLRASKGDGLRCGHPSRRRARRGSSSDERNCARAGMTILRVANM